MSDQSWSEFGKKIWDAGMNAHRTGAVKVIVPFQIDDGGTCTVEVTPPYYVESRLVFIDGEPRTEWRHGKKKSNGEIEWGEWSL